MSSIEIITNVFIPILSGFLLFIYFMYFVFIEDQKSRSTKFFIAFLISFCLFLSGRPVQILSGVHPVPLIINNIRSFIFSAVTIPSVILADFSRPPKGSRKQALLIFATGVILGAIYCIFNTLTTTGSKPIFFFGSILANDSVTPEMSYPYYGREVTVVVYLFLATFLFIDSISKIKSAIENESSGELRISRAFLYNIGKIIFALTFFFGSLLHQWWIYYAGSIFSVTFLGYGVTKSIKENRRQKDNVISYIRENLIQELSIDVNINRNVSDMLSLLNIPEDINTFIALKESAATKARSSASPYIDDTLLNEINTVLIRKLGKNQFILIPMGSEMLGICLAIPSESSTRSITTDLCEYLKSSLALLSSYDFGIGRSYSSLDELKNSYKEAVYAVEYANSIAGGQVININDIQDKLSKREYPIKEKSEFLSAIRVGDREKALEQLESLNEMFLWYFHEGGQLLKIRTYELIGGVIESGMEGGGNIEELLELSEKLYTEAAMISRYSQLTQWLKSRTEEIVDIIARSHSSRSNNLVKKAIEYIDEHFNETLSVKDVADAVCISESYLKSLFKKCGDKSYTEYLTDSRIKHAKNLLRTTDKSVTEVSAEVGYQTANAFSSVFKKYTGVTPTQYKKNEI